MSILDSSLDQAPLGKKTPYVTQYQPDLLCPIPRSRNREAIGITGALPFQGEDIWNGFEISWLNAKGKPVVAGAELILPCESPCLIESKSFKLYLNSFNNTVFDSFEAVKETLIRDLSKVAGAAFKVTLFPLKQGPLSFATHLQGKSLDELDISCDTYTIQPDFLKTDNVHVSETLVSDLLKSNCLVTGQPDWGSLQVTYTGNQIEHQGLLRYIVSFRNCNEFAEQCVERVFKDIMTYCQPEKLLVYARYTRRGGLDINPYRANFPVTVENIRLWRQ